MQLGMGSLGDVAALLETAYKGRVVSQVLDDDRYFGLVVWYDEDSRNDPDVIQQTILDTPSGEVLLGEVADAPTLPGRTRSIENTFSGALSSSATSKAAIWPVSSGRSKTWRNPLKNVCGHCRGIITLNSAVSLRHNSKPIFGCWYWEACR